MKELYRALTLIVFVYDVDIILSHLNYILILSFFKFMQLHVYYISAYRYIA